MASNISEEKRERFRKAFAKFDANKNGSIDSQELENLLRWLGHKPTKKMIAEMLADSDKDGSGAIEFSEFMWLMEQPKHHAWVAAELPYSRIDRYKSAFAKFDRDANGSIDRGELKALLQWLGHKPTAEVIDEMMHEADKHISGVIDFEEFVWLITQPNQAWMKADLSEDQEASFKAAFSGFDKDGSGSIDGSELQTLLRWAGHRPSDAMVGDMLTDADKNGSGAVDLAEFLWVMSQPKHRRHGAWHASMALMEHVEQVWDDIEAGIVSGNIPAFPSSSSGEPETPRSKTANTFAKKHPYAVMGTVTEQQSSECRDALLLLTEGKPWSRRQRELSRVTAGTFVELLTIADTNPENVLYKKEEASLGDVDHEMLFRGLKEAGAIHASDHPQLPKPLDALGPSAGLILRQAQLMQFPTSCKWVEAEHKYKVDRRMDAIVAKALGDANFTGVRACIYAHIRVGYGDLGAAVSNACFLRSMGMEVIVAMGGNYQDIPDKIRQNFEDALGSSVKGGVKELASASFDAHLLFDTYTAFAADGDVMGPVLAAIGGKAQRMSLAEFGFSSLQDWGPHGDAPELFSMGIGSLDLGIPISQPLRSSLEEDAHALTAAKLASLKEQDPGTRAALAHNLGDESSDEVYAKSHKLFCGYAHLPVNVINFIVIAASVAVLEDGENRRHVDIVVGKSPRVTLETLQAMLGFYADTLLRWFNRIELQTPKSSSPGNYEFNTIVIGESTKPASGRTLRVLNQGLKLGLALTMTHPFVLGTGDSSLAENISAGKVFIYDAMPHKQDTVTSLASLCDRLGLRSMLRLLERTAVRPFPYADSLKNITGNPTLDMGNDGLDLARLVKAAVPEAVLLSNYVAKEMDLAPVKLAKLMRMTIKGRAKEQVDRLLYPGSGSSRVSPGSEKAAAAAATLLERQLEKLADAEAAIYAAREVEELLAQYDGQVRELDRMLREASKFDRLREAVMSIQDPLDHASALQILNDFHSFKVRFLRAPEDRPGATADALVMRVTSKRSPGFYVRSAISLLRGLAQPGTNGGEAQPAREPAECLRISGLGSAMIIATSVALEVEAQGQADLVRIQTRMCWLKNVECPQILIDLARK